MKTQEFVSQLQQDQIVKAIQAAEQKTSGEIRVFISRHPVETPVAAAQAAFSGAGMEKTKDRNGVLIYVAPRSQKFAIIGDTGVHAQCGDDFWLRLSGELTEHFRKGKFTEGLLHGINTAGELLAKHFPRRSDDINELPDQILGD